MGPPPRMRGKVLRPPSTFAPVGITPAYAGKRLYCSFALATLWDHPRICGEKFRAYAKIYNEWGSPPHMRGKDPLTILTYMYFRITPAYAGKSLPLLVLLEEPWDHPRICGEKHLSNGTEAGFVRITPAYAGKRLKRSRSIAPPAAIVLPFPSVCNRPAGSGGNLAERDAPPFLPAENAAPALPAYSLRPLKAFCGRAV